MTSETVDRLKASAAEDLLRQAIMDAADRIRARRNAASGYDRGTRMAVGALVNAVKANPAMNRLVDISQLARRTGLSRPSMYKYAEEVQAGGRDLTKVSNERVAELHLSYGPGEHEDIDAEFWARYPGLAGRYRAAQWLRRQHDDAWWEQHATDDAWADGTPPRMPEYDELMRQYRAAVQEIAAGPILDARSS